MKRLSLTLAALGMTVGAFAALPAGATATGVTVPQLPGGFVIGGSGYYLQPSYTHADLAYANLITRSTTNPPIIVNSTLASVNPGYDFGWGGQVGYIFPNTGNDIDASYFRFDNSSSTSTSIMGFNNGFGQSQKGNFILPFHLTVTNGDAYQSANATARYDLNQVDLTGGQYINVGTRLSIHPVAGVRWAEVDRKLNENYFAPGTSGLIFTGGTTNNLGNGTLAVNEESDFDGVGPMVGGDVSYYIGGGVGLVGHADTALLFGNIKATTTEALVRSDSLAFDPQQRTLNATYTTNSTRRVVPVVDLKLGLDYTYLFNNASDSDLTLEAGWQASEYYAAVDRLIVVDASPAHIGAVVNNVIPAGVQRVTTSSLGFAGPYVMLTFHA